mgnify:CR=1 FL=1
MKDKVQHVYLVGQKQPTREAGVIKELCTRMAQKVCETTSYNRFGYHVNGAEYYVVDRTEYKEIIQKYVPTIEGNERR